MPDISGVLKHTSNAATLVARVDQLTRSDVLVGIPESKAARPGAPINNATLAYIHEFGSTAAHIPARPFLYPGVKNCRREALAMLRKGALDVMNGKDTVDAVLARVGILARNSVVKAITDPAPPFVPLKPGTIRARLRKTAAGRRQLRKAAQIRRDSETARSILTNDAALARVTDSMTFKPLIDTGQLRAAINYVVVKR